MDQPPDAHAIHAHDPNPFKGWPIGTWSFYLYFQLFSLGMLHRSVQSLPTSLLVSYFLDPPACPECSSCSINIILPFFNFSKLYPSLSCQPVIFLKQFLDSNPLNMLEHSFSARQADLEDVMHAGLYSSVLPKMVEMRLARWVPRCRFVFSHGDREDPALLS